MPDAFLFKTHKMKTQTNYKKFRNVSDAYLNYLWNKIISTEESISPNDSGALYKQKMSLIEKLKSQYHFCLQ